MAKLIPLNQFAHTLVDDDDYPMLSRFIWTITVLGDSYPCARVNFDDRSQRTFLHRLIIPNVPDGYVVDHINRIKTDNRRCNLRVVTYSENTLNSKRGELFKIKQSMYRPDERNYYCGCHRDWRKYMHLPEVSTEEHTRRLAAYYLDRLLKQLTPEEQLTIVIPEARGMRKRRTAKLTA